MRRDAMTVAAMGALLLPGCATTLAEAPVTTTADCAVLMLAAGFIAEHQPPLRLRPVTRDVEGMLSGRSRVEPPETWSPDADPATIAAIARARWERRGPMRIDCPVEKSPFVGWRPGRGELVLSPPAFSPAGDFAVVDAAVLLPGQRVDHYRFMLSGPPKTGWDLHRITFESVPFGIVKCQRALKLLGRLQRSGPAASRLGRRPIAPRRRAAATLTRPAQSALLPPRP